MVFPAWPQVHRSTLLRDWPEAMADFPAVVRRFMQARGVSLRGLARTAHYDPSYLSKVLSGRKPVTPHLGARLDVALDAGGQIRVAADEQASRRPVKAARPSPDRPRSRVAEALRAAADTGTTGLDVAADGLSELIPHYSHLISTTTSAAVYDELLSVRSVANSLLANTATRQRSDLLVSAGWLSALLAMSATDMGDHAAALVWCSDTEHPGQDAGHPELAGWAALTRALIAHYQGQARRSAALAGFGQTVTERGTVIHAKLAAQEMRSLAMLGDADGMAAARRKAAAAIEVLTPGIDAVGAFSIPLAEDPPYTATSLLLIGRYRDAGEVARRVIDTVYAGGPGAQPAKYARTLLILGLAQARLGYADAASAAGRAALKCGTAWPTMVLAGRLDNLLAGTFPGSAPAVSYHTSYVEVAGGLHRPATSPGMARGVPS